MLSLYALFFDRNFRPTEKLVPNLQDKLNYTTHYRNLKLYLEQGLKLTKVHRVLAFEQSAFMKPYIDKNTEKRKLATDDFEKDLFKLLNNSIYGKTMENVRDHVDVKLISNAHRLKKLVATRGKAQLQNVRPHQR